MGSGDDKYYKAFDFGLGLGAGVQFSNIQFALGYNLGLNNLINTNVKFIDDEPVDSEMRDMLKKYVFKNRSITLTLTYLFGK